MNRDFMRQVVAWERIPARRARFGERVDCLPAIADALTGRGIGRLFTHQSAAISAIQRGENVIVATGTASGKSLCYTIPTLDTLAQNSRARALYLFPTKALTQDQLAATRELIGSSGLQIEANVFDGDTPRSQRSKIRRNSRIIMSNPDMLHAGILPFHTGWRDLLANLRYVVIDEIHTYRGIFGSHVANVLRRLQRLCRFYGSDPQFICCSATIANPQEHAERLCEQPFTVIDESENGAPQGLKHFILYNPPIIDEELGLRQSILLTAMEAAGAFLSADVQTAVFARSRQAVEILLGYLRDTLVGAGWSGAVPEDDKRSDNRPPRPEIAGYRGGYLPLERRNIEMGLRSGAVRGVVATNALELGVDIGALDAAVLAGYPGSIASVWQQVGRAGRRDEQSAAIMLAGNTPLDQYICKHPRYLFGRSPEHARINPNNLPIVASHLLCAAYELPFEDGEKWGNFEEIAPLLDHLHADGQLHQTRNRYHYIGDGAPSTHISLRTSGTDNIIIQAQSQISNLKSPTAIGEVDLERAAVTVHEDAIYMHAGQSYLVEKLDWDGRIAHVRPVEADYYTRASVGSNIRELQAVEEVQEGDVLHAHGDVLVVTQATAYRKIKRYSHETLGAGKIDLPPWELDTTGYWLILGDSLSERLFDAGILARPNDYGPNWRTQRQLALARDNHQCRTCGSTEAGLHVHHIRPFKEYGYIRGVNDAYLQANQVDNLATLCASCHRQAEASVAARSAMGGLAYVLRNLAPLFLMCDVGDVLVSAETRNPLTNAPTIVIYERAAAGVGFSETLFKLHHKLMQGALELISDCDCREGCPACVGPPAEIGPNTKTITRRLLNHLTSQSTTS